MLGLNMFLGVASFLKFHHYLPQHIHFTSPKRGLPSPIEMIETLRSIFIHNLIKSLILKVPKFQYKPHSLHTLPVPTFQIYLQLSSSSFCFQRFHRLKQKDIFRSITKKTLQTLKEPLSRPKLQPIIHNL